MEDLIIGLPIGIGLAAACGFRIFVPLLAMSIASMTGHLELAEGFMWIGTPAAVAAFSVATALEIGAYYVPWIDNLMDTVATPSAVIAGSIVTASCIADMSPLMTWSVGIIAGGGTAGVVQVGTSLTRAASTALTGGLGNPIVSTGEAVGSVTMAGLSIFTPLLAMAAVLTLVIVMSRKVIARLNQPTLVPIPTETRSPETIHAMPPRRT